MIWLLLSGYFIIGAIFYQTMAHKVLEDVIQDSKSESEAVLLKKYGNAILAVCYLFWPAIFIFAILLIIFVGIKR